MTGLLYFLFFCSGFSGLIYQIAWVRVFGNVFGNTVYSASLVVAVFMLGLGVGSYLIGVWADRRYTAVNLDRGDAVSAEWLLRSYGYFELAIGLMGLGISLLLPHLTQVSALVSSYVRDAEGWYALSTTSHLARAGIAVILLAPVTLLMGGTLTLLIRYLVRMDFEIGGWRIAVLYSVNTAGAAAGCFLTDFALVPFAGLRGAQVFAVLFNIVAAAGALGLARWRALIPPDEMSAVERRQAEGRGRRRAREKAARAATPVVVPGISAPPTATSSAEASTITLTSLALALCGFAAMGMEILWFRHFTILLGGFRAVFALLLTVILIGIGAGSLAGGFLRRRPGQWLMVVQGLFVTSTLVGLATADVRSIDEAVLADPVYHAALSRGVEAALSAGSGWRRAFTELWFNARPILLEAGIPALLMGFSFPLGNALIQRAERFVGRRAGVLYLANTVGAVFGSLAVGFLLLPMLGMQASATLLTIAAGLAVGPLYVATRTTPPGEPIPDGVARVGGHRGWAKPSVEAAAVAGSVIVAGAALGLWLLAPSDYLLNRALGPPMDDERLLSLSEGLTEVIAVTEAPGTRRRLLTNGHEMSSTARLAQRYMRALAHIPLLLIDNPEAALVIGFGVGNTAHAATLHPSIRRVDVADLSRDILAHAGYFNDVNGDVLGDRRVRVYVNDGRHHLHMQPPATYDLITLEPPPIGYAGVAALYSKEFYALARTRLKPAGYISQWLPAYQVPAATTLAMIRAFIDIFPQAVLLSGATVDLLLVGGNDPRIEIDPARLASALSRAAAVQRDLQRLDLGSVREIVGTFVGSGQKLAEATRTATPVSDDRPLQEYGVRSLLNSGEAVPASVVDLSQVTAWCPTCFVDGRPVPLADGLDTYLALLDLAYSASPVEVGRTRRVAEPGTRVVEGSAYLGAVVPESADLHNFLGIRLAADGKFSEAVTEFREALGLDPGSAATHWNLGAALASQGAPEEAVEHLGRSLQLDPTNGQARYDLASTFLTLRRYEEAVDQFRAALQLMPDSVEARNGLGIALASQGRLEEAIDQFQQALARQPEFAEARRNLAAALERRR